MNPTHGISVSLARDNSELIYAETSDIAVAQTLKHLPHGPFVMTEKKTRKKRLAAEEKITLLDSYDTWLAKQQVKPARAKTGYISASEEEASE